MEAVHFFSYLAVLLSLLLLLFFSKTLVPKNKRRLPPSPPSLPILGHFHLFHKPLHHSLAALSRRYGPVVFLRIGSRPVLVVSSPSAAEECFTSNDITFANRPRLLAGKILGYNYTLFGWAPYGPHWRNIRRITNLEIFCSAGLQRFSAVRSDEVRSLVRQLLRDYNSTTAGGEGFMKAEMKPRFFGLAYNIMMRMVAGKRYYGEDSEEGEKFWEVIEESSVVSGMSNIVDFFPVMQWLGFRGLEKRLVSLKEKRDAFLQGLIEEHRNCGGGRGGGDGEEGRKKKTIIDVMLFLQDNDPQYYTDEIIKGFILNLLTAGTDTSALTIEWAMSLLLNNPEELRGARFELDSQLKGRMVEESDLSNLPCLQAIINETLRLYPAAPLLVPHESSEDCKVGGFDVARGTMLLVNAYAIHRDPEIWEDPTKFKPERFKVNEGEGYRMMPFGSGRRRCPGEGLAMRVVGLALGSLIQCFEWNRVGDVEVDTTEGNGLSMPKVVPLEAMYRPREAMANVLSQL